MGRTCRVRVFAVEFVPSPGPRVGSRVAAADAQRRRRRAASAHAATRPAPAPDRRVGHVVPNTDFIVFTVSMYIAGISRSVCIQVFLETTGRTHEAETKHRFRRDNRAQMHLLGLSLLRRRTAARINAARGIWYNAVHDRVSDADPRQPEHRLAHNNREGDWPLAVLCAPRAQYPGRRAIVARAQAPLDHRSTGKAAPAQARLPKCWLQPRAWP